MFLKEDIGKKMRDLDNPYMTYEGRGFEWRVLKRYQKPANEAKNEFARWLVAARSPMTYGEWEIGDTYISDIRKYAETWEDHTEKDMRGSILKKALDLLASGKSIDYEGATGVNFTDVGEAFGSFLEKEVKGGKFKTKKQR